MPDSTPGKTDVAALVEELKRLRQGEGVAGPVELGPLSRVVLGVGEDDEKAARATLVNRLRVAVDGLPDDLGSAVAVAFGFAPEFPGRYYRHRVGAFASARGVDPRTVLRWADRGLVAVAEALYASAPAETPTPAWWTDDLKLALLLGQAPEVLQVRRVIAAHDGLDELDLAATITGADPATVLERVSFDVFYGGTLSVGPMEASDRVRLGLLLPRALARGETHEFLLRTRIPSDHDLRQHFVCVPRYRCARLEVRVRFPPDQLPRRVGTLKDAFQRDLDDPAVVSEETPLDRAGEVRVAFRELSTGLASGVRWEY